LRKNKRLSGEDIKAVEAFIGFLMEKKEGERR